MIPEFLEASPNVLGIGEIGLNKNTANEATIFQEHLDLAMKTDELILIHTPHLEDKYKGTRMIVDMLKNDQRVKPQRVLHRSRRGAHRAARPRQRLLVRHDALPDDEVHAGAGRATSSRWSARTASWRTRPATGASPTRWRCRS